MTYANAQKTRICLPSLENFDLLYPEDIAVGEESSALKEVFKSSVEHYFVPISTQWANPVTRFLLLKKQWENNTAHLSSLTEIAMHPIYQQIIGMGPVVISLILDEMKRKPGHWFWALRAITGEDPVLPEQRGRIKQMTEAWLQWGKKQGYV